MILADNGSAWFMSGQHDPRWDDEELRQLKQLRGSGFEVVRMDYVVTPENFGKAPLLSSFGASSLTVHSGDAVTLTWSGTYVQNAVVDGAGPAPEGTLVVRPRQTTTYRLTASNPFGSVSRTVAVTVAP